MTNIRFAIVLLAAVVMASGCTAVSRQLGSITANKYADARSGTLWVVPPPQLEPPAASDRNVYISYRNISDSDIDLRGLLRDSAREQGWNVVNDPTSAKYRLRASTRFFGEVEPESGGASAARTMGLISGAAVGVGTGYGIARATDSGVAGAVGGVAAGGLVGIGISNASRPREWALIIDVVLEVRQNQQVTFELATDSGSGTSDSAGSGNARMISGGGTSQGNTSSATATRKSNYFPHGIRLSVWANQMNMTEEEALPEIEKRTERVVTQMLPM
ncbi:complement resistance protein TraT [Marinobacter salexigens]|uniref:Complement resistance protein TraT n=1 Tax=Marinobacter salexigens TaxID=1925763 RepID=A0ABS6A422_9GAMM|nr:complement resistance protein TraT [Marinobacter salexigens]MBU2872729.1 complement resistance protein TraT [Marinobacter salexigens]